jgi:hypothetical protein
MAFGISIIVVVVLGAVFTTIDFMKNLRQDEIIKNQTYVIKHLLGLVNTNQNKIEELTNIINTYASAARSALEVDQKVSIIVDMLIRNAKTEAIIKGLATINSPLLISDEARNLFSPMAEELISYYETCGKNLSEADLFIDVQSKFGDKIFDEICLPLKIMSNACISLAIAFMREQSKDGHPGV